MEETKGSATTDSAPHIATQNSSGIYFQARAAMTVLKAPQGKPDASMNRETVYLFYNIIWVTFVYKPLDFF